MVFQKFGSFRIIAIVVLSLLAGCQSTGSDYGKGKISLSAGVQDFYTRYLEEPRPMIFAVSIDGRHANFTFCAAGKRCVDSTPFETIQYCEIRSKGIPCKVYAKGRLVVWENPNG